MLYSRALATRGHLSQINDFNSDFLSVNVGGMESTSLVLGRPYGGCSILFRKSVMPCITPLASCSERFCELQLMF